MKPGAHKQTKKEGALLFLVIQWLELELPDMDMSRMVSVRFELTLWQ
jgi:hypothetical protein